jgi:hypothetical protein
MKSLNSRKYWNDPAYLDEKQREDPFSVLDFFCNDRSLYETRKDIWDLLYAALTSEETADRTPLERANMLFDYKNLIELIEAVYLIYKLKSRKQIKILFIDKTGNHESEKKGSSETHPTNRKGE